MQVRGQTGSGFVRASAWTEEIKWQGVRLVELQTLLSHSCGGKSQRPAPPQGARRPGSLRVCGVQFTALLSVHLLPRRQRANTFSWTTAEHNSRASGIQLRQHIENADSKNLFQGPHCQVERKRERKNLRGNSYFPAGADCV